MNIRQEKREEALAVKALNIFINEGNIPKINNVSIDKNKGWLCIKYNIFNINENKKILISKLRIIVSIINIFNLVKSFVSLLINFIVSITLPSSLWKYLTIVGWLIFWLFSWFCLKIKVLSVEIKNFDKIQERIYNKTIK